MNGSPENDLPVGLTKARTWLTGKWSPIYRIAENYPGRRWSDACRPDGPGVYRLIALDAAGPGIVPAPLHRVCDTDPTGTLYIGSTRSLRTRLSSLVLTHRPKGLFLSGAGSHRGMTAKLRRRFPPRLLAIAWQSLDPNQRNREDALFLAYKARFGELPPMNEGSGV